LQKGSNTLYCIPASVRIVARTLPFAPEAIVAFGTQSDITCFPCVSCLTQTHSIGMVALAVVLTVASLCTASTISTNWTLILTPVDSKRHSNIHVQLFVKVEEINNCSQQNLLNLHLIDVLLVID